MAGKSFENWNGLRVQTTKTTPTFTTRARTHKIRWTWPVREGININPVIITQRNHLYLEDCWIPPLLRFQSGQQNHRRPQWTWTAAICCHQSNQRSDGADNWLRCNTHQRYHSLQSKKHGPCCPCQTQLPKRHQITNTRWCAPRDFGGCPCTKYQWTNSYHCIDPKNGHVLRSQSQDCITIHLFKVGGFHNSLEEMGWEKLQSHIQCNNSTAIGVSKNTIIPKRTKSMEVRFHCIRCKESQGQFRYFWEQGSQSLGNIRIKHYPPHTGYTTDKKMVNISNTIQTARICWSKIRSSSLRGNRTKRYTITFARARTFAHTQTHRMHTIAHSINKCQLQPSWIQCP